MLDEWLWMEKIQQLTPPPSIKHIYNTYIFTSSYLDPLFSAFQFFPTNISYIYALYQI